MKHFKFLLVLFVALSSCEVQQNEQNYIAKSVPEEKYPIGTRTVRSFEYEGCEYLVLGFGNQQMMSHKGNCKNPMHYENKDNATTGNR